MIALLNASPAMLTATPHAIPRLVTAATSVFSAAYVHEQPAYAARVGDERQRGFDKRYLLDARLDEALFHRLSVGIGHGAAYADDSPDFGLDEPCGDNLLEEVPEELYAHILVGDEPFAHGLDDARAAECGGHDILGAVTRLAYDELVARLFGEGDCGLAQDEPYALLAYRYEFASKVNGKF